MCFVSSYENDISKSCIGEVFIFDFASQSYAETWFVREALEGLRTGGGGGAWPLLASQPNIAAFFQNLGDKRFTKMSLNQQKKKKILYGL